MTASSRRPGIGGHSQVKTVLPGQMISSQRFNIGGHVWRIDYYPNGRDASAKSNSNTISVYLQLTDHTEHPLQVQYKLSLLDHGGNAAYDLPVETGSFTTVSMVDAHPRFSPYPHLSTMGNPSSLAAGEELGPGCGNKEFIRKEELEKRREDLIRDDRIVLRCVMGITQIECSSLVQDKLSEEEESDKKYEPPAYYRYGIGGYGPPPRGWRQRHAHTD